MPCVSADRTPPASSKQSFRSIRLIALGATESAPILADAPNIGVACHHPVALTHIASDHRAPAEHRVQNIEDVFSELGVIDIEIVEHIAPVARLHFLAELLAIRAFGLRLS